MTLPEAIAQTSAPRSFRDPAGCLFRYRGRILRAVHDPADLEYFLHTGTARRAVEAGKLVRSARVPRSEMPELGLNTDYLIEHERIDFPGYPYEWPPEMLYAAAALTLELAFAGLEEGVGLKDATPYNVLFKGSRPVFVDVLSFERRDPLDPAWMAYAQFVRAFLLPLLASRHFGMSLDNSLARWDGLEPETVYRWLSGSPLKRLSPAFLSLVSLPNWLGAAGKETTYTPKRSTSPEKARFIVQGLLKSCARQLKAVEPLRRDSAWSGYLDHKSIYTPRQFAQKEAFVADALALTHPRAVLDVGANEGHFSFLAARHGSSVVAIDADPAVVGSIWRTASRDGLEVLPLVVDLACPTPATGWRNRECDSFLQRARGAFDLVLMLAVLHHLLVTERIPLGEIFDLMEEVSREYLLIEFVAPEDPMFQRILRGRGRLHQQVTKDWFEAEAARRFDLVRVTPIEGLHRWLYLFRLRRAKT
jgi:SAM-dependent methyltransferase